LPKSLPAGQVADEDFAEMLALASQTETAMPAGTIANCPDAELPEHEEQADRPSPGGAGSRAPCLLFILGILFWLF
jgi:hypothetical protein